MAENEIGEVYRMTQRTMHPNSLANLRPAWQKGQAPAKNQTGPVITPALRRFVNLMPHEFITQPLDRLTVGENIAWVMLYLATQAEGEKARAQVLDRLDGMLKGTDVTVNAAEGANIALLWNGDGEQA